MTTEEAWNALLFMISLEVMNGHLAEEIAQTAREAVDALWQAAQGTQPPAAGARERGE